jgi:hypothetical protein
MSERNLEMHNLQDELALQVLKEASLAPSKAIIDLRRA